MSDIIISGKKAHCTGIITLEGSKSISNRVLIIRALCEEKFSIENLSKSDDTQTLEKLLTEISEVYNAHHAGTTFRFLTAYFAIREGTQILTGSDRMKQRPIGPLVDALRAIGANIEYIEENGFPPLRIHSPTERLKESVVVDAHISSQYISALLMVAPCLPDGLTITLNGDVVSKPYIDMTLAIMKYFGIAHTWKDNVITIANQKYSPKSYSVESDWSAASYYYSIAAIHGQADITLKRLHSHSLQGDAAIVELAKKFGVETQFDDENKCIRILSKHNEISFFECGLISQPDIAQTLFVMCAARGVSALFKGLVTLKIKETDRVAACKIELDKVQVSLTAVPKRFAQKEEDTLYMLEGKATVSDLPAFDTYQDHRMAMAFAPLSLLGDIKIRESNVVTKSYPRFWEDLKILGFEVKWV